MTRASITSRLPILTWALHVFMTTLAVVSLFTGIFFVWTDLTILGPLALPVEILWTLAVLAVPVCSGPLWGSRRAAARRPKLAMAALWIAGLMIPILIYNIINHYWLYWHDLGDDFTPTQVVVLLLLSVWMFLSQRDLRRSPTFTAPRSPLFARILAAAYAFAVLALMGGIAWIYNFSRPLPADMQADVAVVLGAGLRDNGSPTEDLADRVKLAVRLYQQGRVRYIMLSGAVWKPEWSRGSDRNEVDAMRQVCLFYNIPDEALILDPVGFNTRATAVHALKWMQEHGLRSVVVCTSSSHLLRSTRSFETYATSDIAIYAMPSIPTNFPTPPVRSIVRDVVGNVVYTLSSSYREPPVMSMSLKKPRVVVKKASGILQLFDGDSLKKSYTCISGGNPGDKTVEGDRKTPEGTFHIVYKNPLSKFHLSLGLDYPNREDAARGLEAGLITQAEYDNIVLALASDLTREENQKKLWYTKLGGEIFIHGHGEGRTGTAGCIAVSNADVEELYAILPLGTEVVIQP